MNHTHPLVEQFVTDYAKILEEAEKKIRDRGEIDFSFLLTDTDEEYHDERPCVCVTDRHDVTIWDIVEKVYWDKEHNRMMMSLVDSGTLPIIYCDGFTAFYIYRDVLLTE